MSLLLIEVEKELVLLKKENKQLREILNTNFQTLRNYDNVCKTNNETISQLTENNKWLMSACNAAMQELQENGLSNGFAYLKLQETIKNLK